MRKRDISITKSLLNVLQKDIETFWIEEKIKNSVKKFNSDVIDHLRETDFDWNFIDYSWQALSRFESRRGSSRSWVSSKSWEFFKSRERSIEERSLQSTKEKSLQQSSIRSSRVSSITRNFLNCCLFRWFDYYRKRRATTKQREINKKRYKKEIN